MVGLWKRLVGRLGPRIRLGRSARILSLDRPAERLEMVVSLLDLWLRIRLRLPMDWLLRLSVGDFVSSSA